MSAPRKHVAAQPLTVVEHGKTSPDEMQQALLDTRRANAAMLAEYHRVWYEARHTWAYTQFLGVGLMKAPSDLWAYQEIVHALRPRTIVETGTYMGASALWFAFLQDILCIEDGRVLTVDLEDRRRCAHPRITFLGGDSADPALVEAIAEQVRGPVLVVLDSDHSAAHVLRELELYAPLCQVGDWLVVEDTNISWPGQGGHPGDRGAAGGLDDYLARHPGEWRQDLLSERWLLTMNPGGWMQRMRPLQEGAR